MMMTGSTMPPHSPTVSTPALWQRLSWVLAVLLGLVMADGRGTAAASDNADQFIRELGGETIQMLTNKSLTQQQRDIEFRRLLLKGLDMEAVSRLVLGRHVREATDAQRTEFQRLFIDYIVQVYSALLGQYNGEGLTYRDSRDPQAADVTVSTVIERKSGPPIRVEWLVHDTGTGYKITDVVVEGVSMVITQRQQFDAVIQQGGGRVDTLLDALRKQTTQASAK